MNVAFANRREYLRQDKVDRKALSAQWDALLADHARRSPDRRQYAVS
ncbi:MAG: hypothetical protein RLN59_01970 [Haliea sp.]